MKKLYVLIAVAIIGAIGWCASINATGNIIDLGTIDYSNTHERVLIVEIDSTAFIDLVFISSSVNESALYIDNCWFSPLDNKTTYVFATKQIEVDWWFMNDTRIFIYQDNNTKQLYSVSIDYAEIEIPSNPVIEWETKYNITASSFDGLQQQFNDTLNELNETKENLQIKWDECNTSEMELDNKTRELALITEELQNMTKSDNDTKKAMLSANENATLFKGYYNDLNKEYNNLQQEHNNLSGAIPLYIVATIAISCLAMFIYNKRRKWFGHELPSKRDMDQDTGHSTEAGIADRFTGIKTHFGRGEKKVNNPQPKVDNPQPIEEIHTEIDQFKLNYDTFQKSTTHDIQDVQNRVEKLETKVKAIA